MTKILFSCWQQDGQHQDGWQDNEQQWKQGSSNSCLCDDNIESKCWQVLKKLSLHSAWLKIEFLELLVIFPDFKDFLFLLLPLESTTCLWHPPVNSNVHHSPPVLTTQLQQYFANPAISEEWEWIMFYLEALTPTAWFQCLPLTSGIHHSALAPTTQLWCPPLGFSTHDSAPALTTCLRHSPLVSSAHHSSPAPTTQLQQDFANQAIPKEWQQRLLHVMAPATTNGLPLGSTCPSLVTINEQIW